LCHNLSRPSLYKLGQIHASNQINFNIWHVHEHVGTHIDAPIHYSEGGQTAEQIPVDTLVVPLAIIEIRERAENDSDKELRPEDISAWESGHGELPKRCCVAVNSGWDRYITGKRFRSADEEGVMHFPGVHVAAAQMLLEERDVVGFAIDAILIDHGPINDYSTRYKWLPAGRWAVENLANLSKLSPVGATIVVCSPSIVGSTGGPSRIFALV
jgi:kynurenine formamidase